MTKYYIRQRNGNWHAMSAKCYKDIARIMETNPTKCEGIVICYVTAGWCK